MRSPSAEHLGALIESAVDGILLIDGAGFVQFHNEAAQRLFGYGPGELVGREVRDLIPDDTGLAPEESDLDLPPHLILAFVGLTLEVKARHRTGESFPVEITISRVEIHGDEAFTLIARDVSARLAAQAEAQRLQTRLAQAHKLESVGQLAAGVAHEINTPTQYVSDNLQFLRESVTSLLSWAQSVTDGGDAAAETGRVLEELRRGAEEIELSYLAEEMPRAIEQALEGTTQIAEIVSAMKAFCHPGSQQKAPVDLNSSIRNTLRVSHGEWKYVAQVDLDLDEGLRPVPCIDNEIKQVILNLIVNAAHALADKFDRSHGELGTIEIRTQVRGDWAEIVIADNGPGIPAEHLDRLFDPFFTTKDPGKGTGQGLAIAHSIVTHNHAGELRVQSEPGQGTTFVIRLPT